MNFSDFIAAATSADHKAVNDMDGVFGKADLQLVSKAGTTPVSALAEKEVVGIYFSAHWYHPHLMC